MATSESSQPSILIAGAGPVGLTAAIELARRGFTPQIIDAASGPAGESRAFGIHARTLEIFELAGITETLLSAGNRVHRSVFYDDRGEFMRIEFSLARQKYNFALMLPQSETEKILLSALQTREIDVEWDTPLDDFRIHENEIQCTIAGSVDSRPYDILIGCDGSRSTVRKTLGIGFAGKVYEHDWQLVDVRLKNQRPTDEIRIKTTGNQVLAYFPLSPDLGRFVFSGPDVLEAVSNDVEIAEVIWQSDFRISHRIVETYQQGNVFLAGDAAHVHSPVGGRGMNLGIEDAATLAWLIENNQTARYTSMRKPIGQAVLRFTDQQTRQITSGNPLLRFARRYVAPILMKSKMLQRFVFGHLSGANTPRPPWL
jgi:2-polyprenyl-6-methoxyphenol hydroxylase-like FAD-dependent oxidoreductase